MSSQNDKKKKHGSGKGLKAFLTILIVVAACVLGFCIYKLVGINSSYKEAENVYKDVGNLFETRAQSEQPDFGFNGKQPAHDFRTSADAAAVAETEGSVNPDTSVQDDAVKTVDVSSDENAQGAADTEHVADTANADNAGGNAEDAAAADGGQETGEEAAEDGPRHATLLWDFQKLLDICSDGVGYIYQEPKISYPIVQAENNDKYLRHMINGEYNIAGTLFVDSNFKEGLNGRYSIIYGHNMDDKSMFGSITSYKDEKYYKEHPEFELYVGDDCYIYRVFAAFQTPIIGYVFNYEEMDDEEFLETMQKAIEETPYQMDAPEITKDSIVTVLSTCIDYPRDYNYRYVVFLVRSEELLNDNGTSIKFHDIPNNVLDRTGEAFRTMVAASIYDIHWERYIANRGYKEYEKHLPAVEILTFLHLE